MWNRMRKNSTVHFETKNETENPESEFYFLFFLLRTCTWELKHVCCLWCVFHTFVFCIHIYIPFSHVHERRNGMDRERKVIYIHLRGDDEEGEQAREREKRTSEEKCVYDVRSYQQKKNFFISNPTSNVVEAPHERKREWNVMGEREEIFFSFLLFYFIFSNSLSHSPFAAFSYFTYITHNRLRREREK